MRRLVKSISLAILLTVLGSLHAKTLDFSLVDSYGRTVTSQEYQGVPIFLEFGACW